MFLKQDTFNYGDQSVVMTELSGLQRVECKRRLSTVWQILKFLRE